jgi:menaquinone-dependent protoporphyrinogen oxidase
MTRILVAFATRNGSTEEVAGTIAATLRDGGCAVELRRAAELRDPLEGCDLLILGAPLYSGRWHRDAHRLLRRHRDQLGRIPVAVFGMGPRTGDEEGWRASRGQLDRALAKRAWLAPVAVAVFGGVDPPKRRRTERRDLRDWDAIRAWAGGLPDLARHAADPGIHPPGEAEGAGEQG